MNSTCADYVALATEPTPETQAEKDLSFALLDLVERGDYHIRWNGESALRLIRAHVARETAALARWKHEQLTVTAWWAEIDAYVRKHPSAVLGRNVSAEALRLLKEGDANLTDALRYRYLRSKRRMDEAVLTRNGWLHVARAWQTQGEVLDGDSCDAVVDLARTME